MSFLSLLEAKRDGQPLTASQLQEMVQACVSGQLPDYQLAAMLMAIYFRGMNEAETRALTMAMRDSGQVLELPRDPRPVVDKHSTGGVGDKVSLPLAPLLACLGFRVPMISGRGLGITGGTLDKLDSIPGFQTCLPADRILEIVHELGCVICGQTEDMVPADRILYSLRDVTGTVPSIPLIVSSILSKKLAEGLDALVLDVKFGAAAFMPARRNALQLARALVALGNECGVRTRALLTAMDTPLGRAAGNWLEVKEAVHCLQPEPSPAPRPERDSLGDLRGLVLSCAAHLLVLTGKSKSLATGLRQAEACMNTGGPLKKWNDMLAAQGADLQRYTARLALDSTASAMIEVKAARTGYLSRCDARIIGEVVRDLGGGRSTKDSVINHEVGVDRLAKPGERVAKGAVLARLHAPDLARAEGARSRLATAFDISGRRKPEEPLIRQIVSAGS